jgi:hypothetical protein
MRTRTIVTVNCLMAVGLLLGATQAQALPINFVNVQPIQVCDDAGLNCANPSRELFLDEGNKIWAQADIMLVFNDWQVVNSSAQLNEDMFGDLGLNANSMVANMWFVSSLSDCGGPVSGTLFGCASSSGRVAITDAVFSFNSGNGRLDTIAHELGHVVGLGHGDFGAGDADNVMTSGSIRTIPTGVGDINPDGAQLSKLTDAQITQARSSSFAKDEAIFAVIPEPSAALLFTIGFLVTCRRLGRR